MNPLSLPCVFDVVVSDFGRESSIEFLRSVAILEKRIIRSLLSDPNAAFFDEYRRIMFTLIGDIGYFKQSLIERRGSKQFLDAGVLIGIGELQIPYEVGFRLTRAVLEQIVIGIEHGYDVIRVVIPCNTLSPFGSQLAVELGTPEGVLESVTATLGSEHWNPLPNSRMRNVRIQVLTVPTTVLEHLHEKHGAQAELLVLGTTSTRGIYVDAITHQGLDYFVIEPTPQAQELMNETVVASIDGDASRLRQLRQRLESEVVRPHLERDANVIIVEACTDFELSLGLSSRECFVQRIVRDAYGLQSDQVPSSISAPAPMSRL